MSTGTFATLQNKEEKKIQDSKKEYLKKQLEDKSNYDAFKRLTEK
ncbi:MAG: hypothetical protein PHE25_03505 [Candidatus Gracilibacteria bacterium]|nr:hypothetical protein [Candidatus Gracilibacteria bacterium]